MKENTGHALEHLRLLAGQLEAAEDARVELDIESYHWHMRLAADLAKSAADWLRAPERKEPLIDRIADKIGDLVYGKSPYTNSNIRPRLEPGETGGYLWDGEQWVYDVEATPDDLARYKP